MKKTMSISISIILSVITIFCVSLSAFAETTTKYWEPRPNSQDALGYVNSEMGGNIYSQADPQTGGCKITYNGDGKLTGWEFPLLEEGKDYEIISRKGNSITIKLINKNQELPYINALVDFGETTTLKNKAESNEQTSKQSKENKTNESSTTKKTSETTISTTQKANTTIPNHINTPINNIHPESNSKNTNKIIIPCITGVCILIIIFIIAKKHKH